MPLFGNNKSKNFYQFIISVLMVVALGACASSKVSSQKTYQGAATSTSYNTFLIVSVGKQRSDRIKMERSIVQALNAKGSNASSVTKLMKAGVSLSKASVTQIVKDGNIDAILVVNLLDTKIDVDLSKKRTETVVGTPERENLFDIFLRTYEEVDIAQEMNISATVSFSADLYSGMSGEKLWSVNTTVKDGTDVDPIINDAAKSIVEALADDKIL